MITSAAGSLSSPSSLAFDANNRLWVANHVAGTLVRYDPAQLAAGGAPAPAITISGLGQPTAIAFDATGGLWVTDNTASTLSRYDAGALAVSGAPDPSVVLRQGAECFRNPLGLAFDAAGTLWVANLGCGNVVGFDAAQLQASGSPSPGKVLSLGPAGVASPVSLAFDGNGELWVLGSGGALVAYAREHLHTGAPLPSAQVTISDHNVFWGMAFWPTSASLPVHTDE